MIMSRQFCFSILLLLLSMSVIPFLYLLTEEPFEFETSVWCLKGLNDSNIWKGSIIKGFNHYSELQKIQLSSVQNHNQFYANLSIIDTENYILTKQTQVLTRSLVLARFKPNNIMHTIHDDIFPIFLTLEFACAGDMSCMQSYDLVLHDNHSEGPFFNLYKLLSKHSPLLLSKLNPKLNFLLCFREMLAGLVLNGIVYQYGFKKPHGPIIPSQLSQNDVSRFTSFLKKKLLISEEVDKSSKSSNVLLFSRQKNRKILNKDEVQHMIEDAYKILNKTVIVNLINLDLFSDNLTYLLKMVSQASGLVGMHGAELILSLFLKPNSFVIEIFPFGINPEVVSFIKPFSQILGTNFIYFSWKNELRNNSVVHPNAHPSFGGISHLDEASQTKIKNSHMVPAVRCCNNPLFLYHMYQDTYVSSQFRHFLKESFYKILTSQSIQIDKELWYYPHTVQNVGCNFQLENRILQISWSPPFNVKNYNLKYSVFVKDEKGLLKREITTDKTILYVEVPAHGGPKFEIWISVVLTSNNFKSPDLYINCN